LQGANVPKVHILIAATAAGAAAIAAPDAALADPVADRLETAFFGGRAAMSSDLSRVPQWSNLVARERKVRAPKADAKILRAPTPPSHARRAPDVAPGPSAEQGLSILASLTAINVDLNENPYRADAANWSQADYWATSAELSQRGGDCEDYAAAKYFALRRLGIPADDMRIAIVVDDAIGERHAILLVRIGAETFALDNRQDRLMRSAELAHYRPLIAMNENAWWLADDEMRAAPQPALMAAASATPIG
jgi:predicted transglutaminase-like cysteine proteinase